MNPKIGDYVVYHATSEVGRIVRINETLTGRQTCDIEEGSSGVHLHELDRIVGVSYIPASEFLDADGRLHCRFHTPHLVTDYGERLQPATLKILEGVEKWLATQTKDKA